MKKKIAVIVSYIIEADRDDYIQIEKGSFREDFVNGYNEKFPDEIQLTENLHGVRNGVTVLPLNSMNVEECPICGLLMTDPEKPNAINIVAKRAINVQGINICSGCDWELQIDMSHGRTVQSIIDEKASNTETIAAMKESIDISSGIISSKSYKSARELFDELASDE